MEIIQGKKYFESPTLNSFSDLLERAENLFSDRIAIRYHQTPQDSEPVEMTYHQWNQAIKALATSLLRAGEKGKPIAVMGENSYEWMTAYLATTSQVGTIVPLDRLLPPEEIVELLARSQSSTFFCDASMIEGFLPYLDRCPSVHLWVIMRSDRLNKTEVLETLREKVEAVGGLVTDFERLLSIGSELITSGEQIEPYKHQPEEVSIILFTSGTTSQSKAVMLTQKNVCADICALMETVQFKEPLSTLSILPIHHTFECTCGFLTIVAMGGCIHEIDGLRYIAKNLKDYHVHMIIAVPTIFEMFYRKLIGQIKKQGMERKFKFARKLSRFLLAIGIDKRRKIFGKILTELGGELYIAISGAAALDQVIIDFFYDIGVEILQGYGMTETAPVVAGCNTQSNPRGTCGAPLSGVTLAINNNLPGEEGEILIKGAMVMQGYYENPEATEEVFDSEGWLHSGDVGRWDAQRQALILTGRTKSMIVLSSGKKVFPEEIESLLNQHRYVKDSLVFAQKDENGDLVLTAKLILDKERMGEDGANIEDDQFLQETVKDYVASTNSALPSFKGIRAYAYSFQDMIRTTTLKVKRFAETERITKMLNDAQVTWRDMVGKNLDKLVPSKKEKSSEENEDHDPKAGD